MARVSLAHSPKSISWQVSLQNGRNAFSGSHATGAAQVGHLTVRISFVFMEVTFYLKQKGGYEIRPY